jgi:hypothetical protein
MVTVIEVPAMVHTDPSVRSAVAVGALRVTVLPSGSLTSLDGTSAASNATGTALVTAGSWGDVVCDGGMLVYSHTALAVAFEPPANASYVPASYTIQVPVATAASFPAGDPSTRTVVVSAATSAVGAVTLPSSFTSSTLRHVAPGLTAGVPYHVRVSAAPPTLPADVTLLPSVFR